MVVKQKEDSSLRIDYFFAYIDRMNFPIVNDRENGWIHSNKFICPKKGAKGAKEKGAGYIFCKMYPAPFFSVYYNTSPNRRFFT